MAVPADAGAVDVMDREGYNYDLFSELHAAHARYVIRLANDRRLVGERQKLRGVLGRAACLFRREVQMSPRAPGRPPDRHAARHARVVTLDVSAMAVELSRSSNFAPGSPPSPKVNVVTVLEHECPKGEQPIEWYLLTNEPIGTTEQVAAVVEAYRARWVIEELFKALKSGRQIERRQLESYEARGSRSLSSCPLPYDCWPCNAPRAPILTLPAPLHLRDSCNCYARVAHGP